MMDVRDSTIDPNLWHWIPMPPTICLDFDGVIHSYTSGWQGVARIPDPPVPGAIEFIERLQEAGYIVAVNSSRSRSLRGRWAMKRWLERHIIDHFGCDRVGADDCFSAIRWPWTKPGAYLTIDDRAWTFRGEWPSLEEIRAFRPWNKP